MNSAGALDTNFGGASAGAFCQYFGTFTNTYVNSPQTGLQVADDDSLYVTGSMAFTNSFLGALARYTPGGDLDPAFGYLGVVTSDAFFVGIQLQVDGNLVGAAGGNGTAYFSRFLPTGGLDWTFGGDGQFLFDLAGNQPYFERMRIDATGSFLATYSPHYASDPSAFVLTRVTSQGAADVTFNDNAQQPGFPGYAAMPLPSGTGDFAIDAQPLSDGHIFLVGSKSFDTIYLARLANDASADPSYGDASTPGLAQYAIADTTNLPFATVIDAQGRLLIAAGFAGANIGGGCTGIMRIIPDQLFGGGFDAQAATLTCPP